MNANEEPRKAGTFIFVSKWKSSVPRPANRRVVETSDCWNENSCSKHCEHVLQTEHEHLRLTERPGIVNRLGGVLSFRHSIFFMIYADSGNSVAVLNSGLQM